MNQHQTSICLYSTRGDPLPTIIDTTVPLEWHQQMQRKAIRDRSGITYMVGKRFKMKPFAYNIGDWVRISYLKRTFDREYDEYGEKKGIFYSSQEGIHAGKTTLYIGRLCWGSCGG